MMKKIFLTTVCAGALLGLAGCNFLDIQPDDKLTHEQLLTSEANINASLNGVYMGIARPVLYGANLSGTTIECLARRYNTRSTQHASHEVSNHSYTAAGVSNTMYSIWEGMYAQLLAVNEFMEVVQLPEAQLSAGNRDILLGEAYALRAFLHFDLLRLFGPVYCTDDSTSKAYGIPYNDTGNGAFMPVLAPDTVMNKIQADLLRAETLLANDPIIAQGVVTAPTNDIVKDFYTHRNYRMNYYAVKALQARVWLWRGNKPEALAAAKTVIQAQQDKKYFNWIEFDKINSSVVDPFTPDRLFSTEVIFGVYNSDMYKTYNAYFSGSVQTDVILAPSEERLVGNETTCIFNNGNDWRYAYVWKRPAEKTFLTLFKFAEPVDFTRVDFEYYQPLIRIAEMYYIAAECEPDPTAAWKYLTTVRDEHRAVSGLATTGTEAELNTQIQREYSREFFGEGQLFFYYKRLNVANIPDGNTTNSNLAMDKAKYCVPMPDQEREVRNI